MTREEIDVDLSLDEVIEQDLADYINSLFHTSRFYFDEAKLINTFGLETVHKYSYYGNPGERCEFFNIYAWYLQKSGYSSFDEFELHRKIMKLWYSGVITGNFAPPGSSLASLVGEFLKIAKILYITILNKKQSIGLDVCFGSIIS